MSKHIEYKIHQNHNNNRKSNHQKIFISEEMIYVYATIINIFPLVTLTSSIKEFPYNSNQNNKRRTKIDMNIIPKKRCKFLTKDNENRETRWDEMSRR